MGQALRGLTTRGRSFLAAAAAAGISALIIGKTDLLRVSVLLLVLPLLAAAYVGQARYRLACTRTIEPARVPVSTSARVMLRLSNLSRLPTGTLMLEDKLPYALGSRPRLVLERLGGQRASAVAYPVRAEVRGRYEVGPLTMRLTDPFGLCELNRSFLTTARLTVIPQVVTLPNVRLAGAYAGSGDSRSRSVAVHGDDDVATREYRHGDDLRRVHWRSTARAGELMVRREEQPWESRATVVLDTRRSGHRGEGPDLELRVGRLRDRQHRAAPSPQRLPRAARHRRHRRQRRQRPGSRRERTRRRGRTARLPRRRRPQRRGRHRPPGQPVRQRSDGGIVVAVLGGLTVAEADSLGALRSAGSTCIAFLIDPATWMHLPTRSARPPRPTTAGDHPHQVRLAGDRRRARREHRDPLAAGRPGTQSFAWRAAMAETVAPTGRPS